MNLPQCEEQENPPPEEGKKEQSKTVLRWVCGILLIPLLLLVTLFAIDYYSYEPLGNEARAIMSLDGIHTMQEVFRKKDLNGNGVKDFWTKDLWGLYALRDSNGKHIGLMPKGICCSDYMQGPSGRNDSGNRSNRIVHTWDTSCFHDHHGYYIATFRRSPRGRSYQQDVEKNGFAYENKTQYAFMAFPSTYNGTGSKAFIMNQSGTIWYIDAHEGGFNRQSGEPVSEPGTRPIEQFPKHPLEEGYSRLDLDSS